MLKGLLKTFTVGDLLNKTPSCVASQSNESSRRLVVVKNHAAVSVGRPRRSDEAQDASSDFTESVSRKPLNSDYKGDELYAEEESGRLRSRHRSSGLSSSDLALDHQRKRPADPRVDLTGDDECEPKGRSHIRDKIRIVTSSEDSSISETAEETKRTEMLIRQQKASKLSGKPINLFDGKNQSSALKSLQYKSRLAVLEEPIDNHRSKNSHPAGKLRKQKKEKKRKRYHESSVLEKLAHKGYERSGERRRTAIIDSDDAYKRKNDTQIHATQSVSSRSRVTESVLRKKRPPRRVGSSFPMKATTPRPATTPPGPPLAVESGPTLFDLKYDHHTIHNLAAVKIKIGLLASAMKLCHDTLLAWYRDAWDLLCLIRISTDNDMSNHLRMSNLREQLAGMWCVCAHVVAEIGEKSERPDSVFSHAETAGGMLAIARACPFVGNHPWIILARSRLQFFGLESRLDALKQMSHSQGLMYVNSIANELEGVFSVAIEICNGGLRASPCLYDLLVDAGCTPHDYPPDDLRSRSLDEKDISCEYMLEGLSLLVQASQTSFVSSFLFQDSGARILLFEANRLSLARETIATGSFTRFIVDGSLDFGLGRFRYFHAIDFRQIDWTQPLRATPASLLSEALIEMRVENWKEDSNEFGEASAPEQRIGVTDKCIIEYDGACVKDMEFVCSGCYTGGFQSNWDLQDHEESCFKVRYDCPACSKRGFRTKEELMAHKAVCSRINSTASDVCALETSEKPKMVSFDREETTEELDHFELIDALDYLVEFTTTTAADVKVLAKNDVQMEAAERQENSRLPRQKQVGLRCLFCRTKPGIGEEGSFVFPRSTDVLSRSMWRLCLTHFDHCVNLPRDVKERYEGFRKRIPIDDPVHELYWRSVGGALTTARGVSIGISLSVPSTLFSSRSLGSPSY